LSVNSEAVEAAGSSGDDTFTPINADRYLNYSGTNFNPSLLSVENQAVIEIESKVSRSQLPGLSIRDTYNVITILIILAVLYTLTWLLAVLKKISPDVHRKIWNISLLLYFLVSLFLGILLIIRVQFKIDFQLPFNVLFWHVESGIALSVIGILHVIRHGQYFLKLFKNL
jgi:hypothetical protein